MHVQADQRRLSNPNINFSTGLLEGQSLGIWSKYQYSFLKYAESVVQNLLFLLVSRRIAELHGGQVSVKSDDGQYGLLTFEIPIGLTPTQDSKNYYRPGIDSKRKLYTNIKMKGSEESSASVRRSTASMRIITDSLSFVKRRHRSIHAITPHDPLSQESETRSGHETVAPRSLDYYNNSNIRFGSVDLQTSNCAEHNCTRPDGIQFFSSGSITTTGSISKANSYPRHLRCLIVDDVAVCRKMLCRVMAMRFESIEEATDGLDALQKVQSSITDDAAFDIILMDFQMPVMDGPTATREIRISGFQGIIIGVTGNVLPEDLQLFLDSGANYVFTKPLNLENFDQAFKTIYPMPL